MNESPDKISLETLAALESRLQRLTYAIHGANESNQQSDHEQTRHDEEELSASEQIELLNTRVGQIVSQHPELQELMALGERYPDLFHGIPPSQPPSTLDVDALASIVVASAPLISLTASQLTSIHDLSSTVDSSTTPLTHLIAQRHRIAKARARAAEQRQQVEQLRARTAALFERWIAVDVLAQGECWVEWEERLRQAELAVRRKAYRHEEQRREEQEV